MERRAIGTLARFGLLAMLLVACGGAPGADGETQVEIVTAFIGDLAASATASGKVLPQRTAALAVETAGRVEAVFVRLGDPVAAGDPLLQLESDDLELSLASARQDLAVEEANLLALQQPATELEIAAAEAAVASAEAQLQDLLNGPRPEEVASAEANVRAAEAGVWSASAQLGQAQENVTEAQIATARANLVAAQLQLEQAQQVNEDNPTGETHQAMLDAEEQVAIAQAELDALLAGPEPGSVGAAQAELGAAAAQRDARQAELNMLAGPASASQIARAQATLAQAEATLATLREGPSAADLRAAEARVEQARLAVADAQERLDVATVRAPFAGRVTALHASEGEIASGVAVEVMDMESLRVVLTVNEADVGRIAEGQPALITLEAWPDEEIESTVRRIAPAANAGGDGLVNYEVFIGLGESDLPIRAGMTANARLVTAQREDVLLVPNRAIIADRESGAYYVEVPAASGEEESRRVEVTIGLRDDENTQITSGLEAGDRVLVGSLVPDNPFAPGGNGPRDDGPFGDD